VTGGAARLNRPLSPADPSDNHARMGSSGQEVRRHLIEALHADAIGPFGGRDTQHTSTEALPLAPSRWYLTGFLAPQADRDIGDATEAEQMEAGSDIDEEEGGAGSEPEPKQKKQFPASLGLSVLLPPGGPDQIEVTLSFGEYFAEWHENDGKKRRQWRRRARPPIAFTVPLDRKALAEGVAVPDVDMIRIRGKLETVVGAEDQGLKTGVRGLSLFVVNERREGDKDRRDEQFLFQVELELHYAVGFVARPNRRGEKSEQWDDNVVDLQFRARVEHAVGHNVSVDVPPGQSPVTRVRTCFMPRAEVARVRTATVDGVETRMTELAKLADPAAIRTALGKLPAAYSAWIAAQRAVPLDSAARQETRDLLMDNAEKARKRIDDGIALLETNDAARRAFTWMNEAMAAAAIRRGFADPSWHLFQLAFVLLNIRSMVEPASADRQVVELIFFPTGGGKTEAYLGLIGFSLLLRRIQGRERADQGLGVAVLLRYTLRLLTLDQLGRAATLICALDRIRQANEKTLGGVRFAIGLWVGRSATANTLAQVKPALQEYRLARGSSPFPLAMCPWCGEAITGDSFQLLPPAKPERVLVSCPSFKCEFSAGKNKSGLPVLFVDEQIYRECPSFVIATVDKFAMMPWRGEVGMLFGRATAMSGSDVYGPMDTRVPKGATPLPDGLRPPELIVQDELHLISGPLGTMVGLYETAISALCTLRVAGEKPVLPKIVASTATVRRADKQIHALFGRTMALFPPPGLDENETFFSCVDTKSAGRLYVGFAGPGRPLKQLLLRAYVGLLTAAKKAHGSDAHAADGYMTVAGYFNSLRELGGMRRLVDDQVQSYAARQDEGRRPNDHVGENPWFAKRVVREPVELTSRENTGRIKESKNRLAMPFEKAESVDVLLASNMISVGIDIERLGLMVVAGQPKTTSEYIQASSRVGRNLAWPGLVVTCFNLVKPRDRSHFERFGAYHASFYRFVEAQSLTPFSGPALDRGLVGVLFALARHRFGELTPSLAAMKLMQHRGMVDELVVEWLGRIGSAAPDGGSEDTKKRVKSRANNVLDAWEARIRAAQSQPRSYSPYDHDKGERKPLLRTPLDEDAEKGTDDAKFVAQTSMRDVEQTAHLWFTPHLPPAWRTKGK
jgi:hypothetical protein